MRVFTLVSLVLLAGCTPAGPSARSAEPEPAGPTLTEGVAVTSVDEAAAAALYARAREAAATGDVESAEAAATRVVEDYPGSRVSVEALHLRAELRARRAGTPPEPTPDTVVAPVEDTLAAPVEDTVVAPVEDAERWEGAREDLERLLSVLPPRDPREAEVRLLLARVLVSQGEAANGVWAALSLPPGTVVDSLDAAWVGRIASALPTEALGSILADADPAQPLRIPLLVSHARRLRLSGDEEGARAAAQAALDGGAFGAEGDVAAAIVEGRALPRSTEGPVPVGVVLPLGGSPVFQIFSRELQEGIEAAVESWGLTGEIELMVMDDGGDVRTAANLVRAAEARGAVAVVGLLDDASLAEAARMRTTVPLISPFAYDLPVDPNRTLSLNAFDPGAAEALAVWAAESGIQNVSVIHGGSGSSADEARLFSARFEELGGVVVGSFPYQIGTTFWEEQILGAVELAPEALVLTIPPEDVPGIASQMTFFGVDTLGVRLLGTGGWTDPEVLTTVEERHTDGVVAASPIRPDSSSQGYLRFREAYEQRFQRGLVDGTIQALGYDAASLVFQGIYAGAGQPEEVALALDEVAEFHGATGLISVVEGEVRRAHHVVCLEGGMQRPILSGQLPAQEYRPYQPDPETEEVPEGPGRPDGFSCPLPLDSLAPVDTLLQRDTLLPVDTFFARSRP